jgi:hypothetical protein
MSSLADEMENELKGNLTPKRLILSLVLYVNYVITIQLILYPIIYLSVYLRTGTLSLTTEYLIVLVVSSLIQSLIIGLIYLITKDKDLRNTIREEFSLHNFWRYLLYWGSISLIVNGFFDLTLSITLSLVPIQTQSVADEPILIDYIFATIFLFGICFTILFLVRVLDEVRSTVVIHETKNA